MSSLWMASYIILWVFVIFEAVVILALARQIGLLHTRLLPSGARTTNIGLEIGSPIPSINTKDIEGNDFNLAKAGKPRLLAFVSPTCHACSNLLPGLKTISKSESRKLDVILITANENHESNIDYINKNNLESFTYIASAEIAHACQVSGSPYVLVVDSEGKVASKGLVNNLEHLESLIEALKLGIPTVTEYVALQEQRSAHV
jgi:methylamine dehydrogenase accessory protein MauD